jgi:hypothetical protein
MSPAFSTGKPLMNDSQKYNATTKFDNVMTLYGNHFKFVLNDLPDLTFFAQTVVLPDIGSTSAPRHTPFSTIHEIGDHMDFGTLQVSYLIDTSFLTYFSLFHWLKGYGFPTGYDDIAAFNAERQAHLANPRPLKRELHKTSAVLYIMRPDTDQTVVEIAFEDVCPTQLGQITFSTVDSEPPLLKAQATFVYTDFSVRLTP